MFSLIHIYFLYIHNFSFLTVPDLPPRIDRGVKPPGGVLLPGPTPGRNPNTLRQTNQVCVILTTSPRFY